MRIDPEIDYTDKVAVKKLVKDIELAIKANEIKKSRICKMAGMHITTYSRFKNCEKWYVTEARCRALVEAVNKFHDEPVTQE